MLWACGGGDDDAAECGNGKLEAGELCDGDELGGVTCAQLGFGSGTVTCNDRIRSTNRVADI